LYSIQKSRGRTQGVSPVAATKNGRRTGSALIELMLAITILIIVLLGTSTSYVSGRRQIVSQQHYQAAAELASQKLEEIKAVGYSGLAEGEQDEELPLYGRTYHRNTKIELTGVPSVDVPKPCKKVAVTITWAGMAQEPHEAKIVTYVGP
jgi:type II secretory pathway pseudopilin PulG